MRTRPILRSIGKHYLWTKAESKPTSLNFALASAMAIVSGVVCVAAGFARLGFVTELLSKPIRYGYMNGIALTVFLSQLPKLLGFAVRKEGPLRQFGAIASGVLEGKTNVGAFVVGAGTLALILVLQRRPRIPAILIAVVAATLAVDGFNLASRAGVSVLGPLPQGLPIPSLPLICVDDVTAVLTGGLAVALVSFADTSVLSRAYARGCARRSTRTRRWSVSVSRTSQPAWCRAFQSAAAHRAPRWPRLPAHARS